MDRTWPTSPRETRVRGSALRAKRAARPVDFRSKVNIRHHSQAVRQRSAKSPFSSSILDGASKKHIHPSYGVYMFFWQRNHRNRTGFDLWMVPSFSHPAYGVFLVFGKETTGIELGSISGWCHPFRTQRMGCICFLAKKPPESNRVRSLDGAILFTPLVWGVFGFWPRNRRNRTEFDLWMVPSFLHPAYGVCLVFGKETTGIELGSISGWCLQKPLESSRVRSRDGGHCCSCPLQPRGNCFTAYNTDKIYITFFIKSVISYCTFVNNVV